jgi:hypothetical protein
LYKTCARDYGLKGANAVIECEPLHGSEMIMHETVMPMKEIIVEHIAMEVPSQEECQGTTHKVSLGSKLVKANSNTLNLALVRDEFDADNEQYVDENDESSSSESDEENIEAPFDTTHDVLVATGGEGNESNMPQSVVDVCDVPTSIPIDWMLYYTEELRALKSKHINLLEYPKHKDRSHIGSTVCDSAVMDDKENPRVRDEVIKKSQLFESLDAIKIFFQDYAV